jgi:ATP-dependent protease ClpP protease subunit
MPDWKALGDELKETGSTYDVLRRKYLESLSNLTERNVIIYYSGWLQSASTDPSLSSIFGINDNDKNAFMTTVHDLDRRKGLDLVLHTPGGDGAATESLVDYLRSMFGDNIRAIVPQLALSAGTMIALSCKSIVMGKQSSLGPIDPQISGLPAHGVIEEFVEAFDEIKKDSTKIPIWQAKIARFPPTLIGECRKAIRWSEEMVREWLRSGMFKNDIQSKGPQEIEHTINNIIKEFGDHALTKSHARHIPMQKCKDMGLKVETMEDNQDLQEAILTLHHITMRTITDIPTVKIVENQQRKAYIQKIRLQ